MSDVSFALREFAGLEWPTLNHKGRMAAPARRLNIGFRRVRSIYQNEDGVALRADEAAAIAAPRQERVAAHEEYQALEDRLARLEAYLQLQDEGFHSPQMAGLRAGSNAGRGRDGA